MAAPPETENLKERMNKKNRERLLVCVGPLGVFMRSRPVLVLVTLIVAQAFVGLTQESRATAASYQATAFCAWHQSSFRVAVYPPPPAISYSDLRPFPEGLPPPWDSAYTAATVTAVDAWESALHTYAASNASGSHLSGVSLEAIVLEPGADLLEFDGADIRILFSPSLGFLGGATTQNCQSASPQRSVNCSSNSCTIGTPGTNILMSSWLLYSFTPTDVYSIVLHELGHALGLSHVEVPAQDVMVSAYPYEVGDPSNPPQCISTLNVAMLSESFQWLTGTPYSIQVEPIMLPASDYQLLC